MTFMSNQPDHLRLQRYANLLRQTSLFVARPNPLMSKQMIFLTLAGEKPVSSTSASRWIQTGHRGHAVAEEPAAVAALLQSLGLAYKLTSHDHFLNAEVALDPAVLQEYDAILGQAASEFHLRTGRFYGYPETAVQAFVASLEGQDTRLPMAEQQAKMTEAGISDSMGVMFAFSRAHWPEELAVMIRWAQVLDQFGLLHT
jgi:hypothetical protein